MILTYHSGACIRAQAGDTTLVFAPISKQSKDLKPTNFGADVALIPLIHPDMNGAEEVRGRPRKDGAEGAVHGASNQPFVISGPGEFEIKDVTVTGFGSGSKWDGEPRTNTIYSVLFDGLSILYLGAQGELEMPGEVLEMDSPDVLILPVGGNGALTPAEAQKLAVTLESKIIIPVLYDLPRDAAGKAGDKTLKQFLKEAGEENTKPVDKLTLKPRDVVGKESEVVVLSC